MAKSRRRPADHALRPPMRSPGRRQIAVAASGVGCWLQLLSVSQLRFASSNLQFLPSLHPSRPAHLFEVIQAIVRPTEA